MLRAFLISQHLQMAYTINGIQYYLRKIPLVKRLFWNKSYEATDLKTALTVLGIIWEIIKIFASKLLYLGFVLLCCLGLSYLPNACVRSGEPDAVLFMQTMFFFTMLGAVLNNCLFDNRERDYYAICLMRMDARKYVLTQYSYYLIHSTLSFMLAISLVGGLVFDLSLIDSLIITVFIIACKLSYVGIFLSDTNFSFAHMQRINALVSIIMLALTAILPLAGFMLPMELLRIVMLAFSLPAIFGIWKVITFDRYNTVYRRVILESRNESAKIATDAAKVTATKNAITKDDNETSKKHGYAYMHELFIKRHKKLLWRSSIRLTVVIAAASLLMIALVIISPDLEKAIDGKIISFLPALVFVMYIINKGLPFTQALYINCDNSMLTFSFYKKPEAMLRLFLLRLSSIVKINLLPATAIGIGISAVQFVADYKTNPIEYGVIIVSCMALSAFFSVHYLVIYYLLQPYTASTEVKSPAYSAVKWGTYIVCYAMLQVHINSIYFGIGTIAFCIIYCLIACLLVYRLAPKTFKIKY